MRLPENLPVDTLGLASLRSFAPARASLLRDIGARQHSVMSTFGGAPQVFSCYVDGTGGSVTVDLPPLRVPPGTTRAVVGFLARGRGPIEIHTSVDTNGVGVRAVTGTGAEQLRWVWGSASGGTLPLVSRTLVLSSSAAETWGNVTATATALDLEIFAVAIIPQHYAR
jgi:hypothetical protein